MAKAKIVFVFGFTALAGCASYSPAEVAKPTDISIKKAMMDVADAIHSVEAAYPPENRVGLIVDEVEIKFNVAAKANNGGTQQLNLATPLNATGGNLSAMVQGQQSSESNRGNIVTVKLKNIATADMTKGAYKNVTLSGAPHVTTRGRIPNSQVGKPERKPDARPTNRENPTVEPHVTTPPTTRRDPCRVYPCTMDNNGNPQLDR